MRFKSDLPYVILFKWLITQHMCFALSCDKTFTYYEEYGQNSFNVSCSGIGKGFEHILENITINNEISLTVSDSILKNVTSNLFKNVKNIKILHIFNSTFQFSKNEAIFNKLEKLETLKLQDTNFYVEKVTLQSLNYLKHLELNNNTLSSIATGGLKDLINLEKLAIINNRIKNLEDLQLCELKRLKYLIVKRNLLSNLNSYHFSCVKPEKSLDFDINNMPSLPNVYQSAYYNVNAIGYDLIDLDLSFNQIINLGNSLDDLEKLRILDLGYNKLSDIKHDYFRSLFMLQKLFLNHNQLNMLESKVFENKSQLSFIDVSNNFLSSFTLINAPQIQHLDLSYNNLTSIILQNLKGLRNLDLSHNMFKKLDERSFQNLVKVQSLNLAGNLLELTMGLFQNFKNMKYLYLSNNSLINIDEKVFRGLKNLRVLDLSFNSLKTLSRNTFHDLENLETLNLSSNSIESLSYYMVEPLTNLRTLDIAANKLNYIEYDVILSKLPWLSNINIKYNLLTCEQLGEIISFLKQRHIIYTNSEHLDFEKLNQNVAGIPCRSATVLANRLLVTVEEEPKSNDVLFNLGVFLIVALGSILTGIVSYRFYVYLKRRRYRADEFELVVD